MPLGSGCEWTDLFLTNVFCYNPDTGTSTRIEPATLNHFAGRGHEGGCQGKFNNVFYNSETEKYIMWVTYNLIDARKMDLEHYSGYGQTVTHYKEFDDTKDWDAKVHRWESDDGITFTEVGSGYVYRTEGGSEIIATKYPDDTTMLPYIWMPGGIKDTIIPF
jgi:hypothetical protein